MTFPEGCLQYREDVIVCRNVRFVVGTKASEWHTKRNGSLDGWASLGVPLSTITGSSEQCGPYANLWAESKRAFWMDREAMPRGEALPQFCSSRVSR